eukprot:Sspe_Gene.876::Locus_296_Transcript_1_1_Confidence_1.000_Length_702::g.876::m.876
MTGGPGCSSEVALFNENGPCKVNQAGTDTTNNPCTRGTRSPKPGVHRPARPVLGSSTGKMDDHDEVGVANDMYAFLQDLFKDHPEWNKNFYIFGESLRGTLRPGHRPPCLGWVQGWRGDVHQPGWAGCRERADGP